MGVATVGVIGYELYKERQSQNSQARDFDNAMKRYEQDCGKKFPGNQRKRLHDEIARQRNNYDGKLESQDILEIMFSVYPCDDEKDKPE